MVIVDVVVPSIGRKYNFSLDEAISVALLTEESESFELNVSRLSKRLGIGRTSVYRSLESLEKSGAIRYSEGSVKILSKEILKNVR